MQPLLLAIFLVAATVAAAPVDNSGDPVEFILNGVPEGEPLELGDILDIKLKQKVDGQVVSSSDLLYPLTAQAIAEAAAAAAVAEEIQNDIDHVLSDHDVVQEPVHIPLPAPAEPELIALPSPVVPEPIALPAPVAPEVLPEPIALPAPATPEVVPEPVLVPEPVVLPSPSAPEVVDAVIVGKPEIVPAPVAPEQSPEPTEEEPLPAPASQQVYNDGLVSVEVNHNTDPTYFEQVQSWAHIVINYFFKNSLQSNQMQSDQMLANQMQ